MNQKYILYFSWIVIFRYLHFTNGHPSVIAKARVLNLATKRVLNLVKKVGDGNLGARFKLGNTRYLSGSQPTEEMEVDRPWVLFERGEAP